MVDGSSFIARTQVMVFRLEDLPVWQKALEPGEQINQLTRAFPKEERYVLTSQIERAAHPVVLNIAEGSTGQRKAAFKVFRGYSLRSAIEVLSCLFIGRKRGDLQNDLFDSLYKEYEIPVKMITALKNSF